MSAPTSPGRPVVLVTGGSRGIGRAIVEALVADGSARGLHLARRTKPRRARWRSADGQRPGLPPRPRATARRPADLVAEVEKALGPVDGLVNNAGVRREALLAMTSDADWDEVLDVNLGRRCSAAAARCCPA